MKGIKQLAGIVAGLLIIASLAACASLDVVQKDAVRAFSDVLNVRSADSNDGDWQFKAPDDTAVVNWDSARIQMVVDATPFVDAGLDLSKLDNADENGIYFAQEFKMLGGLGETSLSDFRKLVSAGRNKLGYHAEMDHYNIDLDGAMFEWAKDMSANDKDIVFVLNPEPLIAAGVDPENVDDWTYAQVPVMQDGKETQVYKFLKPFDLK